MAYALFCLGYKQGEWYKSETAESQHTEPENETNKEGRAEGWRTTKTGPVWIPVFHNAWSQNTSGVTFK